MGKKLRHKIVAVAVLYDEQRGFLLWNNRRWNGYAFPMRHIDKGMDPKQAALSTLDPREFPMILEGASVEPLECTGAFGISDAMNEETYYDYFIFDVKLKAPLDPNKMDPDLRFFSYEELQAAPNVTWSTQAIARSLVEFQEVVSVVIYRKGKNSIEFLLIFNRNYHYFFPTIRYKTNASPEKIAIQAIQLDIGYDGDVQTVYCGEVCNIHKSSRYGVRDRDCRFHICCAKFPGIQLTESGNELEKSIQSMQAAREKENESFGDSGYWKWFTVEEMRQRADMSPDIDWLLPKAIQIAEGCS